MSAPANEIESLLAEDRWVRNLALQLAGDRSTADDLVQETWVEVLSHAGRPRSARAWLGGVLRNLWRDRARSGARREQRERAAARPEALPSSADLVAEVELRKRVAEAVLALEDPLRRTLVLRFFQDRSLESIAELEGRSVSTIHARVQRGLERLRVELDRTHGGRREAWAAVLLPLARSAGTSAGTIEVVAMATSVKIAVASVLVLGAGAAWFLGTDRETPAAAAPPATVPLVAAPAPPVEAPARPAAEARQAVAASAPQEAMVAATAAASIAGRVVDPEGRAVAGAVLQWHAPRAGESAVSSTADGSFELATGARTDLADERVDCATPELLTLISGQAFQGWTVVVAPRVAFAGHVVDDAGAPVAGAELEFRPRASLFRTVGLHAMGVNDAGWSTASDAEGRFRLAEAAGGPSFRLHARARGFVDAEVELVEGGSESLVVTLLRVARAQELAGVVLDPSGSPVEGASVSAGKEVVTTGADGRFALLWTGGDGTFVQDESGTSRENGTVQGASVIALKSGYLPAREALEERDLELPFLLRLGPAPLSIAGVVRGPDGAPRAGIIVWIGDPTRFGRELTTTDEGDAWANDLWTEDLLCGSADQAAISAADGRFEIGCLMERSYSVRALDPHTASLSGPWSIVAGTRDAELVFTPEPTERVAGRIVTARGKPRAGVEIEPLRGQDWWKRGGRPPELEGATRRIATDNEGRFEFDALATEDTKLMIQGGDVSSRVPRFADTIALADFPDLAHLEIVEPELCEVVIELSGDPAAADLARALDAEGTELEMMELSGFENGFLMTVGTWTRLTDGRSRVLLIKETAVTLVLSKENVEVLRLPIRLEPGERTVLRP